MSLKGLIGYNCCKPMAS